MDTFAGRIGTMYFLARCCGESAWVCCRSMSVGTRSTSPSFRWHGLIAGNGECCRCRRRKTPRERKPLEQAGFYIAEAGEEEVSPSPAPHPLTGMQGEEKSVRDVPGLKCQGCPRLFKLGTTAVSHSGNRAVPTRSIAQLVRAPALQAGGRRFESCTAHRFTGVQPGHMGDRMYRLHR